MVWVHGAPAHTPTEPHTDMSFTTYTTWSESGGVGKTTFAVNMAAAHARNGYDVLTIDLDNQDGGLTDHAGFLNRKHETETDDLVEHMTRRSNDPLGEIIHTHPIDGFDLIPTHDSMRNLKDMLQKAVGYYEGSNNPMNPDAALREVLERHNIHEDYDVLIIDPPTKPSPELRNALYATRNILAPVEASEKGKTSIGGTNAEKNALEDDLGIDIGVFGIIPNNVGGKAKVSTEAHKVIQESQVFPLAPIVIKEREALFGGAWGANMSVFSYVEREKDRFYPYEKDTLRQIQYLANVITGDIDPESVNPEEIPVPVTRPSEHRIAEKFKQPDADDESSTEATA